MFNLQLFEVEEYSKASIDEQREQIHKRTKCLRRILAVEYSTLIDDHRNNRVSVQAVKHGSEKYHHKSVAHT